MLNRGAVLLLLKDLFERTAEKLKETFAAATKYNVPTAEVIVCQTFVKHLLEATKELLAEED